MRKPPLKTVLWRDERLPRACGHVENCKLRALSEDDFETYRQNFMKLPCPTCRVVWDLLGKERVRDAKRDRAFAHAHRVVKVRIADLRLFALDFLMQLAEGDDGEPPALDCFQIAQLKQHLMKPRRKGGRR